MEYMKTFPDTCLVNVGEYEVWLLTDGKFRALQRGGNAVDFHLEHEMFQSLKNSAKISLNAVEDCIKSILNTYSIEEN